MVRTLTSTPIFQQEVRVAVESRNRTRNLLSAIIMVPPERPLLAFETFHTSFPPHPVFVSRVPYRPTESDSSLFYFPAGAFSCSFIFNKTDQFLSGLVAIFQGNSLLPRPDSPRNTVVIDVLHTGSSCIYCISFLSFLLLFRSKFTISSLLHDIFLTYAMLFCLHNLSISHFGSVGN